MISDFTLNFIILTILTVCTAELPNIQLSIGGRSFYILTFGFALVILVIWTPYLFFSVPSSISGGIGVEVDRRPSVSDMSSSSIFRAVLVTVPNLEVGRKIAQGVVKNKLAACVNIIPQVTSIYEWEGKLEEDSELLLIIKTQASRFDELATFVKANHPADVPEVIALPIDQGSKAYLDWVKESTNRD